MLFSFSHAFPLLFNSWHEAFLCRHAHQTPLQTTAHAHTEPSEDGKLSGPCRLRGAPREPGAAQNEAREAGGAAVSHGGRFARGCRVG